MLAFRPLSTEKGGSNLLPPLAVDRDFQGVLPLLGFATLFYWLLFSR